MPVNIVHKFSPRMLRGLPPLLLVLAVALVYANAQDAVFLLDDKHNIVENPAIRRLWPLTQALNPPPGPLTFCTRPFINLTMCVDFALGGLAPRAYHRTSILLHAAAALALFGLVRRTLRISGLDAPSARTLGLVAALLWAVHPLNTAAVNYPSQRGEVAVGLFLFLMLYGLNRAATGIPPDAEAGAPPGHDQHQGGPAASRAAVWLLASVFFCLLGMGSKENMAAAPFLAAAYDRIFLSASWRDAFRKRRLFYAALALTWLWPLLRILHYSPHVPKGGFETTLYWQYPLTQAWGLARMLRLAVWPHPLVFDYGTRLVDSPGQVWPQGLFMLALLGITVWALFRHPRAGFPLLCFFALLAPSSSFFPIPGQPIAEHRMYAPLAAVVILIVLGLERLGHRLIKNRRPRMILGGTLAAIYAVAFGAIAHARNTLYHDRLALWRDTVAKQPANDRAWGGVAEALNDMGRHEEALEACEQALRLKEDPGLRGNLGITLRALGRREEALRQFQMALHQDPNSADAHFNLANLYLEMRRPRDAMAHYRAVLDLQPNHLKALNNLAWLLAIAPESRLDERREALLLAQRAIIENRIADPGLLDTLAAALAANGQFDEAVRVAVEAMALARRSGDDGLVRRIEQRLAAYRAGRPWRE